MDVKVGRNRPARSKMQALEDLKPQLPTTLTADSRRLLIGGLVIGLYKDWISNYKAQTIGRCCQHIKQLKGAKPIEGETEEMGKAWTEDDQQLLVTVLAKLIMRPVCSRSGYTRSKMMILLEDRLVLTRIGGSIYPWHAVSAKHPELNVEPRLHVNPDLNLK